MKRRKEVGRRRRRKKGTEKRRVERGRGARRPGKEEIPNSYPSFYSSTSK